MARTRDNRRDSDAAHLERLYSEFYRVVRKIPRGRVATYGQVAELAGRPGAARAVGRAMGLSRPIQRLPWQRVVGRKSRTTGGVSIHDPVGGAMQRKRLEAEGVTFSNAGTISLTRYGWIPLD